MKATTDFKTADEGFVEWLMLQIGRPAKWIVARSSKKRRKAGYDEFLTERRFRALQQAYQKEATMTDGSSGHLTEPNRDLEEKRRRTPPGMAFWAGTGPAGKTCRECTRWKFGGYWISSGLLKEVPCAKYASMTGGENGPPLPHYTEACKYFEQRSDELPLSEPKKSHAAA